MFTALVRCAVALAIGGAVAPAAIAQTLPAQSWPDRPIRMLISFPPGGSSDAIGRIVQPGLEKRLGQPIVIENRPGAGGMIAIDAVSKAAPDGYTIGLGGAGALGGNVALGEKMPYDPRKDVAPVTVLSASPFILAAAPSLSAKSLQDVIALAKRDKLSIGHGGNGTLMHLTAEMFNQMAGTRTAAGSLSRHRAGGDRPDRRSCRARDRRPAVGGGGDRSRQDQGSRDFFREALSPAQGHSDLRGAGAARFRVRSAGSASSRQRRRRPR